jgi:cation transport regulator
VFDLRQCSASARAENPSRFSAAAEPKPQQDRNDTVTALRCAPRRITSMPYASNNDLPASVKLHFPEHAQDIFRKAFNNAWRTYSTREPRRREEIAHRVAWAAVKKRYRKVGQDWDPYPTS